MFVFDNLECFYISTKNKLCRGWFRLGISILFGGLVYCMVMVFLFLVSLGVFMGVIVLFLSLVYLCFMWVVMKKLCRYSKMSCFNMGLGCLGVVFSMLLVVVFLSFLVINGLDVNFFNFMWVLNIVY